MKYRGPKQLTRFKPATHWVVDDATFSAAYNYGYEVKAALIDGKFFLAERKLQVPYWSQLSGTTRITQRIR